LQWRKLKQKSPIRAWAFLSVFVDGRAGPALDRLPENALCWHRELQSLIEAAIKEFDE
jgi:hypothetical protein